MRRRGKKHYVIIPGDNKYPMQQWLRDNPQHVPEGKDPNDPSINSQQWHRILKRNGWEYEETNTEVHLIFPAEARGDAREAVKETFSMDESLALHGNKMISINISFWTDGIATQEDRIVPKHAWTGGVVKTVRNDSHGIKTSADPIPFNTLMELPSAIEKLLIREEIMLHLNSKMRKYISQDYK